MARLPDFVISGFMKGGTTVLWHNMNQHPDIVMGKNWEDPKKASTEIRFFNNGGPHHTWKRKGLEWYKEIFDSEAKCVGEKSANYIESKVAMERIVNICPEAKIILCIRNPIYRAYSEYQMQLHTAPGKWKKGFRDIVKKTKLSIITKGHFYDTIKSNVLPYCSKEKIIISIQERMANDTASEMNKIFTALGLENFETHVKTVHSKHRDVREKKFKKWKTEYPDMDQYCKNALSKYYQSHNEKLFEFLGYEIPEWSL